MDASLSPTRLYGLQLHDAAHLLALQRLEDDELVHAVDELGPEEALRHAHHTRAQHFMARAAVSAVGPTLDRLKDLSAAQVACHYDHAIGKRDRAALRVCHAAVIQHLQ